VSDYLAHVEEEKTFAVRSLWTYFWQISFYITIVAAVCVIGLVITAPIKIVLPVCKSDHVSSLLLLLLLLLPLLFISCLVPGILAPQPLSFSPWIYFIKPMKQSQK